MIKLKRLLSELDVPSLDKKTVQQLGFDSSEQVEDLSFKFTTKPVSKVPGVLSHEIVTIGVFDLADDYRSKVNLKPYHLIFGENSLAIFDTFKLDTIAGLNRADCEKFIQEKGSERNDAFIAGLSNWAGDQYFQFFNVTRLSFPSYSTRILTHESLHVARTLISRFENPNIDPSQPKWWDKPENSYTDMKDASEEFFAEVLERVSTIAFDRWDKVK